ncbi:2-dehydro-3-deoxyglucarate aldolase [Halogranum amylolyticum]|uniref:2-dehydro-3-deoxyglucarate aldolase n=1 Tax=Halogranum amylolyticum TaxID=660520 RepID=A0A1H8T888_9EURY|nr:aldolase/citrate lyase family protein [Halogranum amylolyticum]SEO86754.1 2-dehydro-3-deoxyglucarate aldolase [Halogranum amylolyticum]
MAPTDGSSGLRGRLADGDVLLGVLDNTYDPSLVEFYGELGLDFVWLDLEHAGPSPWDAPAIEALLRAAERTGIEPLVRLPSADPSAVRKLRDAGVRSLFLPRVESADAVRRAIRAAYFEYDGEPGDRGLASPRARRWGLADDYVTREDEEALVGVTVETRAAVEELDAILDVPGLGFVFIGPLDLSVSLGHPNELDHPDVAEAVETIRRKATDAGVPVGGLGFGMDDVNEKAKAGYQLLNLGSTTGALDGVVSGWLDEFEAP